MKKGKAKKKNKRNIQKKNKEINLPNNEAEQEKIKVVKASVLKFSDLSLEERQDLKEKYKKNRQRTFNIMQYVEHPETGETLITEDRIKDALSKFGQCKYAYILHDKDKKEDGSEKKPHFHIVIQTQNPVNLIVVAERFDIMPNFIDIPKGRNSFGDCCEYLTHENAKEQEKGKHLYDDSEIRANFNFRELIDKTVTIRMNSELRGGVGSLKTYYFNQVHKGKMTLTDVYNENMEFYYNYERQLKYFRGVYLEEHAEMPRVRMNFYVYGEGGAGKDVMSRALARSLFPDEMDDDKIFYTVGNDNVLFDGYDGQPVVIWSDFRAEELLKTFNFKRGVIFKIFDTHPTKFNLNVKYGKINLINKYNIVNSVQGYKDFLDGLSGEYVDAMGTEHLSEDKKQSYRRFPVIIPIRTDDFDVLINKGFVGTGDYFEYKEIKNIQGNLRELMKIQDNEKRREIEMKTLEIPCNEISKLDTVEEVEFDEKKFKNYGKVPPVIQIHEDMSASEIEEQVIKYAEYYDFDENQNGKDEDEKENDDN